MSERNDWRNLADPEIVSEALCGGMSQAGRCLMEQLEGYARNRPLAWVSAETLAKRLGKVSEKKVQRDLRALEKLGWVLRVYKDKARRKPEAIVLLRRFATNLPVAGLPAEAITTEWCQAVRRGSNENVRAQTDNSVPSRWTDLSRADGQICPQNKYSCLNKDEVLKNSQEIKPQHCISAREPEPLGTRSCESQGGGAGLDEVDDCSNKNRPPESDSDNDSESPILDEPSQAASIEASPVTIEREVIENIAAELRKILGGDVGEEAGSRTEELLAICQGDAHVILESAREVATAISDGQDVRSPFRLLRDKIRRVVLLKKHRDSRDGDFPPPLPSIPPGQLVPGEHVHSKAELRATWNKIWRVWGSLDLCKGFLIHNREFPLDVWGEAFEDVRQRKNGIPDFAYVYVIAKRYAAEGKPSEWAIKIVEDAQLMGVKHAASREAPSSEASEWKTHAAASQTAAAIERTS